MCTFSLAINSVLLVSFELGASLMESGAVTSCHWTIFLTNHFLESLHKSDLFLPVGVVLLLAF